MAKIESVSRRDGVMCPYCGNAARLMSGRDVYPHREDLHRKWVYVCGPCKARVGCHGNTKMPLGRLANAELRKAKIQAHGAFDRLWRSKGMSRTDSYVWLAEQLAIPPEHVHIGLFDVATCQHVVELCDAIHEEENEKRRS